MDNVLALLPVNVHCDDAPPYQRWRRVHLRDDLRSVSKLVKHVVRISIIFQQRQPHRTLIAFRRSPLVPRKLMEVAIFSGAHFK